MKKVAVISLYLISVILLLHFFGYEIEDSVRNFYRDKICECDTLRQKFVIKKSGIPYVNYYSLSGEFVGIQKNPFEVAKFAENYLKEGDTLKAKSCIDWLVKEMKVDTVNGLIFGFFSYEYSWRPHGVKPGWRSCLANSKAINALAMFDYEHYLKEIDLLRNAFVVSVDSGGVTYKGSDGWWYEEYAQSGSLRPHVLNGMMYTLCALSDLSRKSADTLSKMLYIKGLKSLESKILRFEGEKTSYYDLNGHLATIEYHNLHVQLLERILTQTPSDILEKVYKRWCNVSRKPYWQSRFVVRTKAFYILLILLILPIIVVIGWMRFFR